MELDNNTIGNLLLGQMQIGLAYNELFTTGGQVGDGPVSAAKARQRMYEMEIGAVFTAGQLLGYKAGFDAEDPATLTQQPELATTTMIACQEGNMDVISPAIKALGLVNSTSFLGSFGDELGRQAAAQSQGDPLAGWQNMMAMLTSYYCNRDNRGGVGPDVAQSAPGAVAVGVQSTNDIPEANRSELGNQLALLDTIAMAGYEFGIGDGIKAAQSACEAQKHSGGTRGGNNKGRKMQRKRKMKGGFLSRETQLNLLTIAIILGGGYAAVAAGAVPAVIAGFDFCYRQGRSILYAMNWLKRPCVSDASIISGLLFKSVPGIGASARTCLEIARMNKIMNTALIGVAGTVYSTAIALGLKVVSGGELMSMPSRSFRLIKTQVSERLLNILESIATNLQPRAIEVFQAIATGAGNASEAVRTLAANIVKALTTSSCPPTDPNTTAVAELAAAELGAQDASDEIASNANAIIAAAGGDQSPPAPQPQVSVTPEQQQALDTILSSMNPENRAAFVELVKIGTALRRAQRKLTEIMALSDDAQKVAAFNSENTEMQKKIIGLMDEAQRTMLTNGGVDTAALLAGGRKRRTRRHKNKKKKAKTMRKKKTRGRRKPKRKTKGKKSKARRKTRNYRR